MNRTKMLSLITLTVISWFYVGVGEATIDRPEPAVPTVEVGSTLENVASSTSTNSVLVPLSFKLPLFPTECTPGLSCNVQGECGVIYSHGGACYQGECVGGACYCY